jgi:STAS domain
VAALERTHSAPDEGEPSRSPAAIVVSFPARVDRASIPRICDQVQALLQTTGAGMVIADVAPVAEPDLAAVEAIIRLKLIASRLGRTMRLAGARPELRDLLAFAGLEEVVPR